MVCGKWAGSEKPGCPPVIPPPHSKTAHLHLSSCPFLLSPKSCILSPVIAQGAASQLHLLPLLLQLPVSPTASQMWAASWDLECQLEVSLAGRSRHAPPLLLLLVCESTMVFCPLVPCSPYVPGPGGDASWLFSLYHSIFGMAGQVPTLQSATPGGGSSNTSLAFGGESCLWGPGPGEGGHWTGREAEGCTHQNLEEHSVITGSGK